MRQWTSDQVAVNSDLLADLTDGATYRDVSTGWVGALRIPDGGARNLTQVPKHPNRPKIGLVGPSPKADLEVEERLAFIEDLEPVDGPPTGLG